MRSRARWALGASVALALVTATAGPAGAAAIWSTAGTMNAHRADALAVVLQNGKVLVAGGNTGSASLASAQLYTPSATGGAGTWSTAGSMSVPRFGAVAGLLQDGRVLVAGGWNETDGFLDSADLYDPREVKQATVLTVLHRQYLDMSREAGNPQDAFAAKAQLMKAELDELLDRAVVHWAPALDTGPAERGTSRFDTRLSR